MDIRYVFFGVVWLILFCVGFLFFIAGTWDTLSDLQAGVMFALLVILLFGVPFVVFVLLYEKTERKRAQEWQAFAESLGWAYLAKDDGSVKAQLDRFRLGSTGKQLLNSTIANVLKGEYEGYGIVCFEYAYHRLVMMIGHRPLILPGFQSVLLLSSPDLKLPHLVLKARRLGDKIGEFVGMRQRVLLGNAPFNERFVLQGSDERRISEVFTSDVMNRLLMLRNCYLEGADETLLFSYTHKGFSHKDRLRTRDDVKSFFQEVCGLAKLLEAAAEPGMQCRQDMREPWDAEALSESAAALTAMPLRFACPHCGARMKAAQEQAGKQGRCVGCGQTLTVPTPSPTAPLAERRRETVTALQPRSVEEPRGWKWPLIVGCGVFSLLVIAALAFVVPGPWQPRRQPQGKDGAERPVQQNLKEAFKGAPVESPEIAFATVSVSVPDHVAAGEEFALTVLIETWPNSVPISVTRIDIADEYLAGFEVLETTPAPKTTNNGSFSFDLRVPRGQSRHVEFCLRATDEGLGMMPLSWFSGDMEVFADGNRSTSIHLSTTVEKSTPSNTSLAESTRRLKTLQERAEELQPRGFPMPRGPRFGPGLPPFGPGVPPFAPTEGGGTGEPKSESPEQEPAAVPPNPFLPANPAAPEGETAKPSAPDSTSLASPAPAAQAAKQEAAALRGGSGDLLQRAQQLAEQVNALPSGQMQKQNELMRGFLGELTRIWPAEADQPFTMGATTGRKPTTGPDSTDWFGYRGAGYWRVFEVPAGKPLLLSTRGDGQVISTIRFTISEKTDGDWAVKQKVDGPTQFSGYRWYFYSPQTSRIRVDAQDMFYLRVYELGASQRARATSEKPR